MRIVLLVCSFVTLLVSIQPSAAKGPFGSISIAGWTGGAFISSKDEFTGCTVSSSYQNGFTAYVSVFPDMAWNIGFSNSNWSLKKGKQFSVTLVFDGKASLAVKGFALSAHSISIEMPNNPSLIEQFRKAATLSAVVEKQYFHVGLAGASQLLPSLIRCVKTIKQGGIAAAEDFTIPSQRATARSIAPPPSTTCLIALSQRHHFRHRRHRARTRFLPLSPKSQLTMLKL